MKDETETRKQAEPDYQPELEDLHDEEPWWVIVAEMDEDYASSTVDAPDQEEAEAEGQRVIIANEGQIPERIARVTGPFPKQIATEARENRPKVCHGCGQQRWCGNHPPAPFQTWFEKEDDHEDISFTCICCGTSTHIPEERLA
jgi:hypothetical protein